MGQMDDLQPELITQILQRASLSPVELCRLCELNRDWREAVGSRELWSKLELRAPDYSESVLLRISKYCGALSELHVVRAPGNPRGLSIAYSSSWLYGIAHILRRCTDSLERLVVSTGCNLNIKDYRSGPFYTQLMKRVSQHCRNLEECEIYYNAGRTGMRSDIPQWMPGFVAGCPGMRTFRLWAPWGDCGGLSNALLGTMASGWTKLETLEVAGEGITLTGVLSMRSSESLRELVVDHVSLGPTKRSAAVKQPSDLDSTAPPGPCSLRSLELAHTGCDLLDIQILHRLFPNLRDIRIREYVDPNNYIDDHQEAQGVHLDDMDMLQHHLRQAELREGCLESPALSSIVTFIDL